MFDLDLNDRIADVFTSAAPVRSAASCGLLYRNDGTRERLGEALQYFGMGGMDATAYQGERPDGVVSQAGYALLFIEAGDDLVQEAEQWRYLLDHDVRVVLVGREDSIAAMREVESLGFYYLLWPAELEQIGSFLETVRKDQAMDRGPQQNRSAMRIAVVAAKGGSGCTLIATELAYVLAAQAKKQVILVDHSYHHSAMSVMLGRQSLDRPPAMGIDLDLYLEKQQLSRAFDPLEAQSQLFRLEPMISYLGIDGHWSNGEQLREYNHQLLASLGREANFIVEDYSSSVNFAVNPAWLCQLMNCVVLVVKPTLTSLVQTRQFLNNLQELNETQSHPARILLVLNHASPGSGLDRKAVEMYLGRPVDIELPWVKGCEVQLSLKLRFHNRLSPLALPFQNLGRLLLGKPVQPMTLLNRLKLWWPRR